MSAQAQKCPYVYGPDVFVARAALMGVNDSLYDVYSMYESDCETDEVEERRSNPENEAPSSKLNVTLYPNPTTGNIFILLNAEFEDRLTLRIFDLTGKLIKAERLVNMLTEVDLVSLSNGMYIYDIYQNNKAIQHGKFIVNK